MGDVETNQNWMPLIVSARCIGCGDCINQCPTGSLGWRNDKAALIHPELCSYCAACEQLCPTAAIELPYLVILKNKGLTHEQQSTLQS